MSTDLVAPELHEQHGRAPVVPRPVTVGLVGAGVTLLCASLPFWLVRDDYEVGLLLQITIYAAFGLSWHFLAGYSGQYAFGHAAFFGTGAYVVGILSYRLGVSPWLGLVVGAVAGAVLALFVGLLTSRLTGLFFGLVTFGMSLVLSVLATHFSGVTGGAAGLSLPLRPGSPGMMQFGTQIPLYWVGLALVVANLALTWRILRAPLGLRLRATRDDGVAAESAGVDTRRARLQALCLSGAMAALAGGLYSQSLLFIDPESAFGVHQSVNAIFTAILGGMGTVLGPVVGAIAFVLLREAGNVLSDGDGVYSVLFYSSVVFVFILAVPRGLLGMAAAVRARRRASTVGERV